MKTDNRIDENDLRRAEQHLASVENTRRELLLRMAQTRRELKELEVDRKRAVVMVGSIKNVLRLALSEEEAELVQVPIEKATAPQIAPDAFKGKTIPESVREVLIMFDRPATTHEIVEGLRQGGILNPHLSNKVRAAVERRDDWFIFVKEKGKFGRVHLVEWNDVHAEITEESNPSRRAQLTAVKSSSQAAKA